MGVANRDIKLENMLLGGDKKKPIIKLTDFGFSKSVQDSIPTTICGTLGYMGGSKELLPVCSVCYSSRWPAMAASDCIATGCAEEKLPILHSGRYQLGASHLLRPLWLQG